MSTIIKTELIKNYSRILYSSYSKDYGFNTLYMNFDDSYIYFQTDRYFGKLKFKYSGDKPKNNFYIDIVKFLTLVSSYPELIWDDEAKMFINPINQTETFKLDYITEGFSIDYDIDLSSPKQILHTNKKLLKHIADSSSYMGNDVYGDYNGLYIGDNVIVATNRYKFYEGRGIGINDGDFYLHADLVKILLMLNNLPDYENIYIKNYENATSLFIDNDELIITNMKKVNMELPSLNDPDFINNYNHPYFFICNRHEFNLILSFLDTFNKSYVNQRIFITIKSEKEALIEVNESEKIIRVLNIKEVSPELIGIRVCLSSPYIKNVLVTFKTKDIKIQMDITKPTLNFTEIYEEETPEEDRLNRHIVIVRLEE